MVFLGPSQAADISGKWMFSVDLEDGGQGEPTFVLKQQSGKLTGTYSGPLGEKEVSGTVTGDVAKFGFSLERDGETVKIIYTAKIDSATKGSGTVKFEGAGAGGSGKWTAAKAINPWTSRHVSVRARRKHGNPLSRGACSEN
jgi:hypothetical protein